MDGANNSGSNFTSNRLIDLSDYVVADIPTMVRIIGAVLGILMFLLGYQAT